MGNYGQHASRSNYLPLFFCPLLSWANIWFSCCWFCPFCRSVSSPFPKFGKAIFIPVHVPKYRECDFSFPFPFPKVGNAVCHSQWEFPIPAPKIWELAELFPFQNPKSHSRSPPQRRGCNIRYINDCKINVLLQMFTYKCSQTMLQRWEYHGLQDRAGSIKCGSCCSWCSLGNVLGFALCSLHYGLTRINEKISDKQYLSTWHTKTQ